MYECNVQMQANIIECIVILAIIYQLDLCSIEYTWVGLEPVRDFKSLAF